MAVRVPACCVEGGTKMIVRALRLVCLLLVLAAPSGRAAFHFAHIDEVLTSYGGDAGVQFVEIEMEEIIQNILTDSVFAAFDTSGAYVADILVVPGNVANAGAGVRWIVGTAQFAVASGLTPDFVMPDGILPTTGGMVCYGGGGGILPAPPGSWDRTDFANYVDCVAYGTYAGPSNALIGTPTPRDGDGHSLERVSGTNDNAADFICGDPATPENNAGTTATLPATTPCPTIDAGVAATKLIVVDKLTAAGKAKTVFVSKDQANGITKGTGTDVGGIHVDFTFGYDGASVAGAFTLPTGASDGTSGWLVNKSTVAKYVNKSAPAGPTGAKVGVIKPGKLLKLVGKTLGDTAIDVFGAGPPAGDVLTVYAVTNGADTFRHCSRFTSGTCTHKLIAGDTGAKLVCKGGVPATCP
jgi:hypothetical protein